MSQNAINNFIASGNFSTAEQTPGEDALVRVEQTDASNRESNALFEARTGGVKGGDPAIRFKIQGGETVTLGLNTAAGGVFTIVRGDEFRTGDQLFYISTQGQVEARHMPRFLYSLDHDSNPPLLTGDNTIVAPILFDLRSFDRSPPDYDLSSGFFRVPFAGSYFFDLQMSLDGVNPNTHTSIHFGIEVRRESGTVKERFLSCTGCSNAVTTKPFGDPATAIPERSGVFTVNKYQFVRLSEGDLVTTALQIHGTAKTVSLYDRRSLQPATGIYSYFSGGLFI